MSDGGICSIVIKHKGLCLRCNCSDDYKSVLQDILEKKVWRHDLLPNCVPHAVFVTIVP